MNITGKLNLASAFINARFFGVRSPAIVNWALTYRCNHSCRYCGVSDNKTVELSTREAISAIDEMRDCGTRKIHFTGGEPLVREDFPLLLDYCRKKGISMSVNSNGALVRQGIKSLRGIDGLSLSLDGPQEIHDAVRGEGSYYEVMEAVKYAKENNVKIRFTTVLSKLNLSSVDFILNKAEELNTVVIFQPAQKFLLETRKINPIAASIAEYRNVISRLIEKKRKNRFIGNSLSGLRHLYHWPSLTRISCANALIICRIEPSGEIYGCADFKDRPSGIKIQETGFKKAFNNLVPLTCNECWCASYTELNCLFSGKPDSIFNLKKLF
ncbi:MAG: radical SAM protein [Candidatus Omnitrophica bacterium]|nr:radical SAM protein [Candidatus Omnitrophota bacterium]